MEENGLTSLTSLDVKEQRFVQLYLTGAYTNKEIASLLQVHVNTIYAWLKREDVKACINEMQAIEAEAIDTYLKSMTSKAVQRINELMDSPMDAIALQACRDVLDRTGHKAKQEIKVDKTVRTIEMQFNDLADALIEDVEFKEVEDD